MLNMSVGSSEGHSNTIDVVKYRRDKVRELRSDIDKLRSLVIDKVAEDMGRRLTCNPQ